MEVPKDAYFGIQTLRAVKNFPISGIKAHPYLINSYVFIKKSAALTNTELGVLDRKIGTAIIKASDEILKGKLRDQFVVDVYQAGAGTSQNMNTNEVIANRAIELLGGKKGDYNIVHPNDHVNMAQSTNDTFPTAMRLSCLMILNDFLPVVKELEKSLNSKARQFNLVIKSGRTHLQDASPITLGQEFSWYAEIIRKYFELINSTRKHMSELGIGGTAVGTGLNTHVKYRKLMVKNLSKLTGLKLSPARNYFESMQSMLPFTELSSVLKNFAVDLTKISNDIRLLASGPTTGLGEIILPAVQPGSSIMPGKVNPSIAEMLNMVCFQVMGNDLVVTAASQAGQLELNVMMPVIIHNILTSVDILKNALKVFSDKCIRGIRANKKKCREYAEKSISIVTALNPVIGYARASELAKEAVKTGRSVIEVIKEKKILDEKEIKRVVNLMRLTKPGL